MVDFLNTARVRGFLGGGLSEACRQSLPYGGLAVQAVAVLAARAIARFARHSYCHRESFQGWNGWG